MQVENIQLKAFLLDSNLIEGKVVEDNFKEASKSNKRLGDLLVEKKLITEIELRKLYAYIRHSYGSEKDPKLVCK